MNSGEDVGGNEGTIFEKGGWWGEGYFYVCSATHFLFRVDPSKDEN